VAAAEALGRHSRALDREGEEVVAGERGRFDECVRERLLVGLPVDVDVTRCSGALGEAQVEREAALQDPVAARDLVEASQEAIEGDSLAIACESRAVARGASLQPLLERLPERCGVPVLQAGRSLRTRSMKERTRFGRLAAAARRRCGVVRPRSSAC
jgi:hypothetical protein